MDTSGHAGPSAASDPVTPVTVFYKRFQNKKENNRNRNSFEKKVTGVTGSLGAYPTRCSRQPFQTLHRPHRSLPKSQPHFYNRLSSTCDRRFPQGSAGGFHLWHNFYLWTRTATTAAAVFSIGSRLIFIHPESNNVRAVLIKKKIKIKKVIHTGWPTFGLWPTLACFFISFLRSYILIGLYRKVGQSRPKGQRE